MSTHSDRGWMYKRKEDGYLSASFYTHVDNFLDVAFSKEATVDKDCIKCPCSRCKNMPFKTRDDVKLHLLQYGFTPNYTTWWVHGEETPIFQHEVQPPDLMEDDELDGCTRMVIDAMGPTDFCTYNREEQVSNSSANEFKDMLFDADEPLWEGCQNYSKLQAASELLNWKSDYNISEAAYDHLLPIIKRMLPQSEKLVGNFYETKKILKRLRLPVKKIDACKNHCMLYYGADSDEGLYQWEAKYTDEVMRGAWETAMIKRFPDTMKRARDDSVKLAEAANVNVSFQGNSSILRSYNPKWIRSEFWAQMVDEVWNTSKWRSKSYKAKGNRNKMEHGSISKHCCGSIPISHHRDLLEAKNKRPPSRLELFEKTHKTKKPKEDTSNTECITPKAGIIASAYEDAIVTRYGDDSEKHPTYNHELWLEVSGGIKKGRVCGFGSVTDPQTFLVPSSAAPNASSEKIEVIVDRIREEMKEELKSEREEMKQELIAEREEIEAKKLEIEKMYNEILKLTQATNPN